jgi:hypothetical protein
MSDDVKALGVLRYAPSRPFILIPKVKAPDGCIGLCSPKDLRMVDR